MRNALCILLLLLAGCAVSYTPENATVMEPGHPLRIVYQDGMTDLVRFHGTSWENLHPGDRVSLWCNRKTSYCMDALLGWGRHK